MDPSGDPSTEVCSLADFVITDKVRGNTYLRTSPGGMFGRQNLVSDTVIVMKDRDSDKT